MEEYQYHVDDDSVKNTIGVVMENASFTWGFKLNKDADDLKY